MQQWHNDYLGREGIIMLSGHLMEQDEYAAVVE
jgi:hypothetical protein